MAKGPRGPRPAPTYLKILRGNPGKEKLNTTEPQPTIDPDMPAAPEFILGYAKTEWERITPELYRMRLLTVVDINMLAAYCQAYAAWRTAVETLASMAARDPLTAGLMIKTKNGTAVQNPIFLTARQAARDMVRYGCEFGFSPAARSRITATDTLGGAPGKFDGLLAS